MSLLSLVTDIRPLRVSPAFRRVWVGNSLSAVGGQVALVAVLYQVWEMTHNAAWVGTVGLAHATPSVVFALVGGSLADTVDRRRLVLLTTCGQALAALLLAAQALAELESLGVVLGLVGLQAACAASGAPARRTFAARLLGEDDVAAGLALTHLGFQGAMLAGPALGGLVIALWGVGGCHLLDAATFGAAVYGVARLPALPPEGRAPARGVRAVVDGWRFVGREPVLRGALLTDVMATVLAMPVALFPAINEMRFGGDPETLGLFLSAVAAGGILAGTCMGRVTRARRTGAVMLGAAGTWGLSLACFGLAEQLWLTLGCLAVAGAADTVSVVSRGALVQLSTPDSHRGRVSAAEHVVGVAGPDLGNFRGGLVAGISSPLVAVVSGGLMCALGVAAVASTHPRLRRFDRVRPRHTERPLVSGG